jgi:serine/threonine protein kinase
MKICEIQKVQSMRRENDILLEKHSLNKIKEKYSKEMPSVKIIATFKDEVNLYFLTEIFKSKLEVWEHCRSFGLIQDDVVRYTFLKICQCVQKLHDIGIIHRDLKPENMFFSDDQLNEVKLIDFGSSDDLTQPDLRHTFINNDPKRGQHEFFVGTSQFMAPECLHN